MAIAAMIAWVVTASIGVYMLRTWVTRGGLRRQRATGAGVPPAVVFGHASAALTGLLIWLGFVKTRSDLLAWLGVAAGRRRHRPGRLHGHLVDALPGGRPARPPGLRRPSPERGGPGARGETAPSPTR